MLVNCAQTNRLRVNKPLYRRGNDLGELFSVCDPSE